MSVLSTAARAIRDRKISALDIVGKSAREIASLIADCRPIDKPKEKITEIKVRKEEVANAPAIEDLFTLAQSENTPLSYSSPTASLKSELKPEPDIRYEIKFSLPKDTYNELQSLRSKLSQIN